MTEFERRALAELEAAGIKRESVAADSLRLEPFGSAFLLRWDGVLMLSAEEVMELLGATPAEWTRETINCECGHGRTLHMGAPGRSPWCDVDGCPCLVFVAVRGEHDA